MLIHTKLGAAQVVASQVAIALQPGNMQNYKNLVFFLLASAVFRDGLAGLFAFGAVLGVNVYGISQADVLIFGVSASVVAACGAALGGLFDDRVGSKTVIAGSLTVPAYYESLKDLAKKLGVHGAVEFAIDHPRSDDPLQITVAEIDAWLSQHGGAK